MCQVIHSILLFYPAVSILEYLTRTDKYRDARTPQPGDIVFNTIRYSSETVHRLGYFHSSVSVQIMFK